jgi:hypothetical protein
MDHEGPQNKIIRIDEALMKRELGEVVRETVEETLRVPSSSATQAEQADLREDRAVAQSEAGVPVRRSGCYTESYPSPGGS